MKRRNKKMLSCVMAATMITSNVVPTSAMMLDEISIEDIYGQPNQTIQKRSNPQFFTLGDEKSVLEETPEALREINVNYTFKDGLMETISFSLKTGELVYGQSFVISFDNDAWVELEEGLETLKAKTDCLFTVAVKSGESTYSRETTYHYQNQDEVITKQLEALTPYLSEVKSTDVETVKTIILNAKLAANQLVHQTQKAYLTSKISQVEGYLSQNFEQTTIASTMNTDGIVKNVFGPDSISYTYIKMEPTAVGKEELLINDISALDLKDLVGTYNVSLLDANEIPLTSAAAHTFKQYNASVSGVKGELNELIISSDNYDNNLAVIESLRAAASSITNTDQQNYVYDLIDKKQTEVEAAMFGVTTSYDEETGLVTLKMQVPDNISYDKVIVSKDGESFIDFDEAFYTNKNVNGNYTFRFMQGSIVKSEQSITLDFSNETIANVKESIEAIKPSKTTYEEDKAVIEKAKLDIASITNTNQLEFINQMISEIETLVEAERPLRPDEVAKPVVSKQFENGTMSLKISEPQEGFKLVYKNGSTDLLWKENFNIDSYKSGSEHTVEFKFIEGTIDNIVSESDVTTFTFFNDNDYVEECQSIIDSIVKQPITEDNVIEVMKLYQKAQSLYDQMKNDESKARFNTKLTEIKSVIDTLTANNPTIQIDKLITDLPMDKSISENNLSVILKAIDGLESSALRETKLNDLFTAVKENTVYQKESLDKLTSTLLRNNGQIDAIDGTDIKVSAINSIPVQDSLKLIIHLDRCTKDSASWKALLSGEIDSWLTREIIMELVSIKDMTNQSLSIDIIGDDSKVIQSFDYSKEILALDFDTVEDFIDDLPTEYEELSFENYFFVEQDSIGVLSFGDFAKDDDEWEDLDSDDVKDFFKSSMAEPLAIKFNKDVNIGLVDEDHKVLFSVSVGAENDSSNSKYADIEEVLNDDYNRFEDFKFNYSLSGNKKQIKVRMFGKNFKGTYDEWEEKDDADFEKFLDEIVRVVMSTVEADVVVQVYDKDYKLLETYEYDKDDFEGSISNIEDYLNSKFRKYEGIYFEHTLKADGSKNHLTIEADVKKSDDEWKDLDKDYFKEEFIDEIANYVITQSPKDLTIDVVDSKGNTLKTYTLKKKDFGPIKTYEKDFNENASTFKTLNFKYELTMDSDIEVKMTGTNFEKDDDAWKNTDQKALISFIESEVIDPLISEFKKDVNVKVYDKKNRRLISENYSKDYKDKLFEKSISEVKKVLSNNYSTFTSNDNSLKMSYSVTVDKNDVFVIAKISNFSNDTWKKINRADFDKFVEKIGLEAVSVFGKAVEVKVVDNKDNTILSRKVSPNTSNLFKTSSTYKNVNSSSFALINETNYLSKVGNQNTYKLDAYLGTMLKMELDGKLKDKTPVLEIDITAKNKIEIEKALLSTLSTMNKSFMLRTTDFSYSLPSKSSNDSLGVEVSRVKPSSLNMGNFIAASNIYELKTGETSGALQLQYDTSAKIKQGFGLYKYDESARTWTKLAADDTNGQLVVENVDSGIYAVMHQTTKSFPDIQMSPYRYEILALAEKGIISGQPSGMFAPSDSVTRAEFAKMAVVGLNLQETFAGQSFKDVNPTDWFFRSIETAKANNIISGYNGLFRPNDPISNEEVLSVIDRMNAQVKTYEQSQSLGLTLPTGSTYSEWALISISNLKDLGVVDLSKPLSGKTFATRGETAHYIYEILWLNDLI